MSTPRDYYEVLGLDRKATAEDVRKAYRRLARTHHPDVSKDADAAERFAEISRAYEVLSDPEKRKTYDRFGHAGVDAGAAAGAYAGGPFPGGGYRTSWSAGGGGFDPSNIGSIFEEMFGASAGPSPFGGGRRPPQPQRGTDIEHKITVGFMVAARGGEERLRVSRPDGGAETIHVRIPPGTADGARLRVKGKGHTGAEGGARGDLLLTVNVGRHPFFRRENLDLLVDVPITIAEAALGTDVEIPMLSGSARLKVPPGTGSGRKLRMKGKGLQDAKGQTGDLYAVVQVAAPGDLSARARAALESIRGELQNPRDKGPWTDKGAG